jgi:hypothetical protein
VHKHSQIDLLNTPLQELNPAHLHDAQHTI